MQKLSKIQKSRNAFMAIDGSNPTKNVINKLFFLLHEKTIIESLCILILRNGRVVSVTRRGNIQTSAGKNISVKEK